MRYCCPFCNVPFSQNTFRQTAEELRMRLQGKVASDNLKDVVKAWVNQLKEMRSEMDVGLAVLSLDTPGYSPTERSHASLKSLQRYLSCSSHLFHVMPAISSNMNLHKTISSVQPLLTQNNSRGLSFLDAEMSSLKRTRSAPSVPLNNTPQLSLDVDNLSPDTTYSKNMKSFPTSYDVESCGPLPETEDEDFNDEFIPPTMSDEEKSPDGEPVWNFPSSVDAVGFNNFVKNGGSGLNSILAKRLYVRELVNILPGTDLARKLPSGSVGVVMKYTGRLQAQTNGSLRLGNRLPISLTIRLLDGSWLTKVAVKDVEAKGKRATLRQYLRVGDLLLTRFGIALACELHPRLGLVTVRFPKGLENFEKFYNICNLDDVRSVCGFAAAAKPNDILSYQKAQSRNVKSGIHSISAFEQKGDSKGSEFENDLLPEMGSSRSTKGKKINSSVLKRNVMQGYKEETFPNKSPRSLSTEIPKRFKRNLGKFNAFETKEFLSIDDNLSLSSGYDVPKYINGTESSWPMSDQNVGRSSGTDAEMKKIYEGDIQSVFSAREIFDVIEQKVAEDRRTHQLEMTPGNNKRTVSFKQRVPSKHHSLSKGQFLFKTSEEKGMYPENTRYLLKPMGSPLKVSETRPGSYDDMLISYSSLQSISPGNCKNIIDFRHVEDS